jgi:hypothetical protein
MEQVSYQEKISHKQIMKNKINYQIGFSDAEIISYFREQNHLTVKVKTWNDKLLSVLFSDVVGVIDCGLGDISSFVKENGESLFLTTILNQVYESIPDDQPYHLFQFLNLDDNPCLEIVAVSQIISENS